MIKKQLVIIPLHLPWSFPCDYEKQTAQILAKKNKVLIFSPHIGTTIFQILTRKQKRKLVKKQVKSLLAKGKKIIFIPNIQLVPLPRFKFIEKLNLKISLILIKLIITLIAKREGKKPILWLFSPRLENLVGRFKEKLCLYDCVDYYASIDKKEDQKIKKLEKSLLKKVDVVFTNSPSLFKLKQNKYTKIFQVPQGCNTELFLKTRKKSLPQEFKKIPLPRITFIGNIDYRLNFNLIIKLAQNNPQWSFIFIGPFHQDPIQERKINLKINLQKLRKIKNIYFLPRCSKKKIISFIDHSQIGFIPYDIHQEFCRYCYPMKVFEYFSRGLPVISTPIESLITLKPYVKIGKNNKDLEKQIKKILKNNWPQKQQIQQKKLALTNSWKNKIEKISQILEKEKFLK